MDSHTIDEYIELEKEIASHEAKSPALILQQKSNQMLHLEERIKQQEENVETLDEQTWVVYLDMAYTYIGMAHGNVLCTRRVGGVQGQMKGQQLMVFIFAFR